MTESEIMIKIKDEIFAHMDELSPAEKKVARALLSSYPGAGLASATALAQRAGTSAPTVLRLVSRLGLRNYGEFQQHLHDEISHQMNSPVSRAVHGRGDGTGNTALKESIAERAALVDRLVATIPPSEFIKAVAALGCTAKNIVISGGYFSRHIAQILALQLNQVVANVEYASEPLGKDISKYLDLRKESVVVIFDVRRYELTAERTAVLAKKQGALVIVFTDENLSPSAQHADIVLPVGTEGIPFDSFVGLLALTESLVEAVFQSEGIQGIERMTRWEQTVQIHRVFRASGYVT